jgi:hypothetical protein
MADRENVEKVRQEIMRFRELLDLMRGKLEDGEQAYTQLFAKCNPEDVQRLKTKDLQWKAAELNIDDLAPLSRAVGRMRFEAHNLERDFEELHGIIASTPES